MCQNIVSIAKSQVGFRIGNDKLLVEAKRSNSDSIILYLSRVPVSQNDSEYLYNKIICFSDMDCFIDSYKVFKKYMESFKNSVLYFYDNEYYLYFEIASTRKNFDILIRLISEYGECSEINKCILDEHGQQVSASGDVKRVLTANVQNE
jgi:negative regulator of genetic competence, sporulation and motility